MTIECITKDSLLQRPRPDIEFPESGAISSSPFTLNGNPFTNRPESLTNASMYVRKAKASTLKEVNNNMKSYFAADNYDLMPVATEHIIGPDPQTTLRYENVNFMLRFIALHSSLWQPQGGQQAQQPDRQQAQQQQQQGPLQVSLFFTSADSTMFHICIPIEFTQTPTDENAFLKYWLYPNPGNPPTGLTINSLFNFGKKATASFATLNYCLQYNGTANLNPYILCLFKNSLKLHSSSLPSWLQKDPTFTGAPDKNRPKTFDAILNFLFRGTINKYVYGSVDPYECSAEQHFDGTRTQGSIKPTYYAVPVKKLVGTVIQEGFETTTLTNVKCYPIDLATQIDDDGNVMIDTATNKPIDLQSVDANAMQSIDPSLAQDMLLKQKEANDTIIYVVLYIIIALILLACIVVLVVYVFPGKMLGPASASASASAPAGPAGPAGLARPATNLKQ